MDSADQTEKKEKRNSVRDLSTDEVLELNEGKDLFRSNLFRLQVSELLSEVRVPQTKTKSTQTELHELKELLDNMEDKDLTIKYIKKLSPPMYSDPKDLPDIFFTFKAPTKLHVIGSFLLNTICKPGTNVDVALEIPKHCLNASDATNCKYEDKRMIYLYHIASELHKMPEYRDRICFEAFRGDTRKPVLCINPPRKKAKRVFRIRIHVLVPSGIFRPGRLIPSRCNLEVEQKDGSVLSTPSPRRNNAIAEDIYSVEHLAKLHTMLSDCPSMIDAILLFKVWLRQREFQSSNQSFNGFLIGMLMIYLIKERYLNSQMSSYQLFRVTLNYLSSDKLLSGISLAPEGEGVPVSEYDVFPIVFLDHSGRLNLTGRVTMSGFRELQYEAGLALHLLRESATSGFQFLFLQAIPFSLKFDQFFRIDTSSYFMKLAGTSSIEDLHVEEDLLSNMEQITHDALSKRLPYIILRYPSIEPWKLRQSPSLPEAILGGIILDQQFAFASLERGPSAEDKEASKIFNNLWKEKTALWQMNDGSIVHAVDWKIEIENKHTLPKVQMNHLLQAHFAIPSEDVHFVIDQADSVFKVTDKNSSLTSLRANARLVQSYEELEEILLRLNGIPLRITEVSRAHAALSYTSTTIPLPHPLVGTGERGSGKLFRYVEAIPLFLQLEDNNQWPKDIGAIEALKSSFYVLLSRQLSKEHEMQSRLTKNFVDVFHDGYAFRIAISLPQELSAVEETLSIQSAKEMRIAQFDRPYHLNIIRGVHSMFSAYSTTVRLAKFWIHGQMLSGAINEETVELLVASLFVSPEPFSVPHSHLVGFLRFLQLLASFPWESTPLVVDVHGELTAEHKNIITKRFNDIRASENSSKCSMFIATSRDLHSSHWTASKPSPVILQRLVGLAKQCITTYHSSIAVASFSTWREWKLLFCTPLTDFDVILRLHPDIIPQAKKNHLYERPLAKLFPKGVVSPLPPLDESCEAFFSKATKFKNFDPVVDPSTLLVGMNPLHLLVEELTKQFGDIAMFFYGDAGVPLVGIVWKPAAFLPQLIKPHTLQFSLPLPEEVQSSGKPFVIRNIFDVVSDIRNIGSGLIGDVVFVQGNQ